jgi:hypothetical protein
LRGDGTFGDQACQSCIKHECVGKLHRLAHVFRVA